MNCTTGRTSLLLVAAAGMLLGLVLAEGLGADTPDRAPSEGARADVGRGGALSRELYCPVCHGEDGNSTTPEWPSLAGQPAIYLERQLRLLRSRERVSLEMGPLAEPLSDRDILDLAGFFAAQSPATVRGGSNCEAATIELYRRGDPARGLEACAGCHGRGGEGDAKTGQPALRGQQSLYLARQLEAYAAQSRYAGSRDIERAAPGAGAMARAARALTPGEIQALARCAPGLP